MLISQLFSVLGGFEDKVVTFMHQLMKGHMSKYNGSHPLASKLSGIKIDECIMGFDLSPVQSISVGPRGQLVSNAASYTPPQTY